MSKRVFSFVLTVIMLIATTTVDTFAFSTGHVDFLQNVSAGGEHTLAIKSDGTLWAWGGHWFENGSFDSKPVKTMSNVISVSAGDGYTMVIKDDYSLRAWGYKSINSLKPGVGNYGNQRVPIKIMDDVVAVSAGSNHTLAIKTDNSLWA